MATSISILDLKNVLQKGGTIDEEHAEDIARTIDAYIKGSEGLATKADLQELELQMQKRETRLYGALAAQTIITIGAVVGIVQFLV